MSVSKPVPPADNAVDAPLGSAENPLSIMLNHGFFSTAHDDYATLREQCPVSRARFAQIQQPEPDSESERRRSAHAPFVPDIWLVTRYDDAVAMMLDDESFSVNPLSALTPEQRANIPQSDEFLPLSRSLLTLDPPDHTRLRRLVQPWFSGRAIDALRPRMTTLAEELLDIAEVEASDRGEVVPDRRMDLVKAYAYPLPVMVISEMLGIPHDDMPKIQRWAAVLLERRGEKMTPEQRENIDAFADYLRALMDEKRRNPADDLTTFLVNAEEEGDRLDENELLSMVFVLYVAGHITTVNLIGSSVVALLTHPEQLAKLRANSGLTRNAVEETLRYWGAAEMIFPRIALRDVEIGGVVIKERERITASLASADRDPRKFANPDVFDIERKDANRHIAFGKGIHVCLGAPLARAEGEIALEVLLRRYPDLRLDIPAEDLRYRDTFLRGFVEVPVRF
jgi:cytochrome P450 PksS